MRNVAQPLAGRIDRLDVVWQQPAPQTAPGDSSPEMT